MKLTIGELKKEIKQMKDDDVVTIDMNDEEKVYTWYPSKKDGVFYITIQEGANV